MNTEEILALIVQAVAALPTLIQTGVNVYDRVVAIKDLGEAAVNGTATDEQIKKVRDQLDADLADFNTPLPDTPTA